MTYIEEGFETGPIRPPSEAGSYLVRLTRGCPWNRCTFCTTYKRERFQIRELAEVLADIDSMARIRERLLSAGPMMRPSSSHEWMVANAIGGGDATLFLQDGDSLSAKPAYILAVLEHLKKRLPQITRITTYARSRTISHRDLDLLKSYRELGLNRIHIGMETAHDPLLKLIEKGVDFDTHVKAGRRVVEAGIELSEYVMPGIGGREMSEGHARDTAKAISLIDPHFVRLRTLCLHPKMKISSTFADGTLTRASDEDIVDEIRSFVAQLVVTRTRLASDHILNLLGELEGDVANEKERLLAICDRYRALDKYEKRLFEVGRRSGTMQVLGDLARPLYRERAKSILDQLIEEDGEDNLDKALWSLTGRSV